MNSRKHFSENVNQTKNSAINKAKKKKTPKLAPKHNLKKNDVITLKITEWGTKGLAIGIYDNQKILVPYVKPFEKIKVQLLKIGPSFIFAKCLEIVEDDPTVEFPKCNVFGKCGGCHYQHVPYSEQLDIKLNQFSNSLSSQLKDVQSKSPFDFSKSIEILPSLSPWNYRYKSQFVIKNESIGLSASRSQSIVNIDDCAVQHPLSNTVLTLIKNWLTKQRDKGKDCSQFSQFFTRVSPCSTQLMVGFISKIDEKLFFKDLCKHLIDEIPELSSILLNINSGDEWDLFGSETTLLHGEEKLYFNYAGIKLQQSLDSFVQANGLMLETFWKKATELLDLSKTDTLLDCYSGTSGMSIYFSRFVKEVICVESSESSINDARENIAENEIKNIELIHKKAEDALGSLNTHLDAVCTNPPRAGLHASVREAIIKLNPFKILYISCNPETLSSDLKSFLNNGYSLKKAVLLDMFPQTYHMESMVLLERDEEI
ncbi:23S rRNA (uracil(1939)-C(5))-methyltransferase RlmD [bacterium]|jgi:23S rRNA (uracil1939-C5)-methyltransferase|nr:23S rRNA (uracil(1939)-C(5))-methyltransferase RlmD [bacterium]